MKNYEMVTVKSYVENYCDLKVTSISEKEIANQYEKYLLTKQRNQTNEKVVESLLA